MSLSPRTLAAIAAVASLAAIAPASAEDDPTVQGEIRFGLQYLLEQKEHGAAKFEEYRDVPNGFVAEGVFFSWSPGPKFFLTMDAIDVAQQDQRIAVDFGTIDRWRGSLRWIENQRLWTDQSKSLFAEHDVDGGADFTLEDSFQSTVQTTAGANVDADGDDIWDPGSKGRVVQLAVAEGAKNVFVGHERHTGAVGFEFTPNRSWTFSVSGARERREGTTPQNLPMNFSLSPAEVAAPYELQTDLLLGTAEYHNERSNYGVQLSTSAFDTGFSSLTWDNQLFLTDTATANPLQANPGRGRMTLWTDSDWARVGGFAGFNLPRQTRIDVSASFIQTTQDEPLLPMTINSLLTPAPLPESSFDGEHRSLYGQFRISSRPAREFRWSAWARLFDMSNESPELTFDDYVQTDQSIPVCSNVNACDANGNGTPGDDRIARRSLAYGFERRNAGAQVGWTPTSWLDTTLGYERENLRRDFSAVEDSDEDIFKLTADIDPGEHWGVRATVRHQERRADEYDAHYLEESFPIGEPNVAAFNEGTRRFYWTDRDRDAFSLLVDWTPVEKWSFYGEATWQDDDYTDPETGQDIGTSFTVLEDRNFDGTPETYDILLAGRTEDKMTSWTVGGAYMPGPRLALSADYTFERWEYGLETRYRNVTAGVGTDDPLDNWGSDVQDDYETINLGVEAALTADAKWHLSLDFSQSRGLGTIDTHFVPGGSTSGDTTLTSFPELETTLQIGMVALNHIVRPNLDYAIRWWYESWDEENFSADFNQPYMGAPSQDPSQAQALYLGLDFRDYTNHILSLVLRYRY